MTRPKRPGSRINRKAMPSPAIDDQYQHDERQGRQESVLLQQRRTTLRIWRRLFSTKPVSLRSQKSLSLMTKKTRRTMSRIRDLYRSSTRRGSLSLAGSQNRRSVLVQDHYKTRRLRNHTKSLVKRLREGMIPLLVLARHRR